MTAPTTKLAAHDHFTLAKRGLKVVVEILAYLERPLSGKDVSADQFGLYLLREIVTAGFTWLLDRFVEHQVGTPDQLVKVVRASTCTFDSLKCLQRRPLCAYSGAVAAVVTAIYDATGVGRVICLFTGDKVRFG